MFEAALGAVTSGDSVCYCNVHFLAIILSVSNGKFGSALKLFEVHTNKTEAGDDLRQGRDFPQKGSITRGVVIRRLKSSTLNINQAG